MGDTLEGETREVFNKQACYFFLKRDREKGSIMPVK